MADLQALQDFASDSEHLFGITKPLSSEQVARLAEYWFPEMRFFETEKFHPISLDEMISMVEGPFAGLPPAAQEEVRVKLSIRESATSFTERKFDPPVVYVPDGFVPDGQLFRQVVRPLNDGSPASETLEAPDVDGDTRISHGASFTRSNRFFGGNITFNNLAEGSPDDPFVPRATGPDGPRITVMASLLNLFDLLKYELHVSADEDYPPDGMRGGFDIARSLLIPIGNQTPLPFSIIREFLFKMIESAESGGAIPPPPFGWRLHRTAWNAVTRFAFLEYDFFYAFNDFNRHEDSIFANEHEGDDEGCCLVFDRGVLNIAATVTDPDGLFRAAPHCIITCVHKEEHASDILKFIPPITASADRLARDDIPFTVYPAAGSHATYLTSGTHDVVDFQDFTSTVSEISPLLVLPALPILIILAIIEHFTDTEDETSDHGVRTGPEDVVGQHPTAVDHRLVILPMSEDDHIYKPDNKELLRLRAYSGKWGGHSGFRDDSPDFKSKTGRYFRKLLSQL